MFAHSHMNLGHVARVVKEDIKVCCETSYKIARGAEAAQREEEVVADKPLARLRYNTGCNSEHRKLYNERHAVGLYKLSIEPTDSSPIMQLVCSSNDLIS